MRRGAERLGAAQEELQWGGKQGEQLGRDERDARWRAAAAGAAAVLACLCVLACRGGLAIACDIVPPSCLSGPWRGDS